MNKFTITHLFVVLLSITSVCFMLTTIKYRRENISLREQLINYERSSHKEDDTEILSFIKKNYPLLDSLDGEATDDYYDVLSAYSHYTSKRQSFEADVCEALSR